MTDPGEPRRVLGDLRSPRLMVIQAGLFVVPAALATRTALWLHPDRRLAALIAAAVWACRRAYYFCFYVIERYLDPGHRFAGIVSAVRWVWERGWGGR